MGTLLTGLVLPFAVGDDRDSSVATVGGAPPVRGDLPASGATGAADAGGQRVTGGATSADGDVVGAAGAPGRSTAASTATSSAGPRLTGLDSGSIKVGFLLLEVASIGAIGVNIPGVEPEQQQAAFQAYVDEYNEGGGFHGRLIETAFRKFDVSSPDNHIAQCNALAEDEKVFAVLANDGLAPVAALCVTEAHKRFLVIPGGSGVPDTFVQRSQGRLFTVYMTGQRAMYNFADQLELLGKLKGRKLGILVEERSDPDGSVEGHLRAALGRLGHSIAHVSRFAADQQVAASQVPVEVRQMQAAGVDAILILSNLANNVAFVQTADNQGYRPDYYSTDWATNFGDTQAQSMPTSYEGAINITTTFAGNERVNIPPIPEEERCREIYERRTGARLDAQGSPQYDLTMNMCSMVRILATGLLGAGRQLTYELLTGALHQARAIPVAFWKGGAYSPGKFDLNDWVRTNVWHGSCRCWKPASDFRPARY